MQRHALKNVTLTLYESNIIYVCILHVERDFLKNNVMFISFSQQVLGDKLLPILTWAITKIIFLLINVSH